MPHDLVAALLLAGIPLILLFSPGILQIAAIDILSLSPTIANAAPVPVAHYTQAQYDNAFKVAMSAILEHKCQGAQWVKSFCRR